MKKVIRKGLTKAIVLEAAFDIVDKQGVEALTMRNLATRLGVAAMALYNHFENRDAILDALADFAMDLDVSAVRPAGSAKPNARPAWKDKLRAIALGMHALASQHPHIYRLICTRPRKPQSGLRLMNQAMAALREAGLDNEHAAVAYHAFLLVLHGFPFWQEAMQGHQKMSWPPDDPVFTPNMHADWNLLHGVSSTERFNTILEWMLDSIQRTPRG